MVVHEFSLLAKKGDGVFGGKPMSGQSPGDPMVGQVPKKDFVKVNVDGGCDSGIGQAGIGCVMQNDRGKLIKGYAEKLIYLESLVVEALAALQGLNLAIIEGWQQIVLETDSQVLFESLACNDALVPWKIEAIIYEIKRKAKKLGRVKLSLVRREENSSANLIAKRRKARSCNQGL